MEKTSPTSSCSPMLATLHEAATSVERNKVLGKLAKQLDQDRDD